MKNYTVLLFCLLLLFLTACSPSAPNPEATLPEFLPVTVPSTEPLPSTVPTEAETIPTLPEPVIELTEEEKNMLLKLGMAERGKEGCTECIALIMRSVLNRVEAGHFRTIKGAVFAQDQYLPVSDGSYDTAVPNEQCYEALNMVICGWDESQGAMFYEWCEGESWHSKNLHLLFQHCDVRFYN